MKCVKLEKHSSALHFIMGDLIKIRDDESEEFCEFQQCISESLIGSFLLIHYWKENWID